jgi:hypothetical protein
MALDTAKHFEKLIGWYGSNGHSVGSQTTWADKALYRVNVILEMVIVLDLICLGPILGYFDVM